MAFKIRKTRNIKLTAENNSATWRSYDGSSNNLTNPWWGVAKYALGRKSPIDYGDGISSLATRGISNPPPREISNLICKADAVPILNEFNLTDMMWVWGQFIDHEIDLTPAGSETSNMECTSLDPNEEYPGRIIPFNRSAAVYNSDPRQQPNNISAFIDGTNIYGHNGERAYSLRTMDGAGKFRTGLSDNGETILPYNNLNLENASPPGSDPEDFFLSGDVRANENTVLTGMHTLFVKEHNRLCDIILQENGHLRGQDEMIFNYSRRIVIGLMQNITFSEFLPYLVGPLPKYESYKKDTDPTIFTEFSTVGYRIGHSMLSSKIRVGDAGEFVLLRDAFFNPPYIQANGTEKIIYGVARGVMKKINNQIIDDIRNFLFESPSQTMLHDLASLNIQRGRDHGIPGYNEIRHAYGLNRISSFSEVIGDQSLSDKFAGAYDSPDNADPWVAAISEDHVEDLPVGPLIRAVLKDQFLRLRDGDRFWFEVDPGLSEKWKKYIRSTSLGDIIKNNIEVNTGLIPKIGKNVFKIE